MKHYEIYIKETLIRRVEIEADNEDDAETKVQELYDNGDIVLSADDFDEVEMSTPVEV